MAVPKKRKSKQKSRQVKAGKPKLKIVKSSACPNCGSQKQPHRMCHNCGYYNGRIYSFKKDKDQEEPAA
ncbi:MAG: 50S ribosomal protein L32 [Candidatus Caenarcaniphilales bacterium]|nr:50S ribosomal protein L32 [Candidatus Caenarcaniphilales bacterium]